MNQEQLQAEQKLLIEDFGILFEESGLPRMAGRILGWLLICNPPHQSAAELCKVVGGSKGSISTVTRLLLQRGLIEKVGIPGRRVMYYRFRSGSWSQMVESHIAVLEGVSELTERGLGLWGNRDTEVRHRLAEIRDFRSFIVNKVWLLLERRRGQLRKPAYLDVEF